MEENKKDDEIIDETLHSSNVQEPPQVIQEDDGYTD